LFAGISGSAWLKPLCFGKHRNVDLKVSGNDVVIAIDQKYDRGVKGFGRPWAEHRDAQAAEHTICVLPCSP
jgi:hypothetical protein